MYLKVTKYNNILLINNYVTIYIYKHSCILDKITSNLGTFNPNFTSVLFHMLAQVFQQIGPRMLSYLQFLRLIPNCLILLLSLTFKMSMFHGNEHHS